MNLKKVYWLLFLVLLVGISSTFFHGYHMMHNLPYHVSYNDIIPMYKRLDISGLPYLNYNIEYPVITGLFIHSMKLIGKTIENYYLATSIFLVLSALAATYLLSKMSKKNVILYWIFAPSMLVFMVFNWDILAILFVIIALYFMKNNRYYISSLFLALGFCSKFYPLIYLPILLLQRNKLKEWLNISAIFGFTVFIVNIFFIYSNFSGWYYFFSFNSSRVPNPDSFWGLIHYLFPQLPISFMNILTLAIFALSYLVIIWRFRQKEPFFLCFIATLLFLISNKVFSPQYILWLLPFFVLLPVINKPLFYSLEISNLLVLWPILAYIFLKPQNMAFLYMTFVFVVIRHIMLIFILVSNLRAKKQNI